MINSSFVITPFISKFFQCLEKLLNILCPPVFPKYLPYSSIPKFIQINLPPLINGEYYLYQLEGLKVRNLENKILGVVQGSFGTKSNEVLIVQSTQESIDDKERLLPYIKPQVVKEISLEEGLMLVDWPDNF